MVSTWVSLSTHSVQIGYRMCTLMWNTAQISLLTNSYFQRLLGSGGDQRNGGGVGGGGPGCQGDQGKKMMHHCQICNRGFLNKSNIKVHLRTHTGEKPFGCEHCSKAFRQKAHLLKHMSIHKRISRD